MGEANSLWGPFGSLQRRFAGISGGMGAGAVVVVLAAIAQAAGSYMISSRTESPLPGMGGTVAALVGVFGAVSVFLGWVITVLIYHVGARLLGGKGSLRRMFALGGIVQVPMLLQYSLRAAYAYAVTDPLPAPTGGPLVELLLAHFTLFSVITLALAAVAIVVNYGVSGKRAVLVVFLPVLLGMVIGSLLRGSAGSNAGTARLGIGRILRSGA